MKQTDLGLNLTIKRTRKREFLAQMERVVPWGLAVPALPKPPAAQNPLLQIQDLPDSPSLSVFLLQMWIKCIKRHNTFLGGVLGISPEAMARGAIASGDD
jgi:hypothetical protein